MRVCVRVRERPRECERGKNPEIEKKGVKAIIRERERVSVRDEEW